MSDFRCSAKAPSNIALIKYMGKEDPVLNLPANPSISLTLDSLCTMTEVTLGERHGGAVQAELSPVKVHNTVETQLSELAIQKIIHHTKRVIDCLVPEPERGLFHDKTIEIRTTNSFPMGSGIASSASGFAALTLAIAKLCKEVFGKTNPGLNPISMTLLSQISRQGSGSSCRSFEGPWVLWENQSACKIESRLPPLTDLILLVRTQPKKISSSQAHELVKTSPLWEGRVNRVREKIKLLQAALVQDDLAAVSKIAWSELWEMHSLFHTSRETFTYFEPATLQALKWIQPELIGKTPPIVTLDAGPNVHFIVPALSAQMWKEKIQAEFPGFKILEDQQGLGASYGIPTKSCETHFHR